jgi:hypothetical protein
MKEANDGSDLLAEILRGEYEAPPPDRGFRERLQMRLKGELASVRRAERFQRRRRLATVASIAAVAACGGLVLLAGLVRSDSASTSTNGEGAETKGHAVSSGQVHFSLTDYAFVNSKWGFIDKTGEVVVAPKYSWVADFSEGLAAVKVGGTHFLGGKYGFIDRTGRTVIEPQFQGAKSFSEGLAAVQAGGKWGCINRKGEFRIQPQFESVWTFHEGLASYKVGKKHGFIDRDGEVIIEAKYDYVGIFREGLAAVTVSQESADEESRKALRGYIDRTGRMVIEPQGYDAASGFSEGLAQVLRGGKHGYIDRDGNLVIPLQYYGPWSDFQGGLAKVWTDPSGEKRGFIDKTGAMVIEPQRMYLYGVRYSERDNTLTGVYGLGGDDESLETGFDPGRARDTAEGLTRIWAATHGLPVAGTMKYGFADHTGKVVIKPQFDEVGPFSEGLAKFAVDVDWDAYRELRGQTSDAVQRQYLETGIFEY